MDTRITDSLMWEDQKRWIKRFSKWLRQHNSPVYEPRGTNEVLRFGTTKGDGVLQCSSVGKITGNPVAERAIRAFKRRASWSSGYSMPVDKLVTERVKRSSDDKARIYQALADRDGGMFCAYCGCELTQGTVTIEHVLPLSKHGLDVMDNMILACRKCNSICSNLSIIEKFKRINARKGTMEKYGVPPEELSEDTIGVEDIKKKEPEDQDAETEAEIPV